MKPTWITFLFVCFFPNIILGDDSKYSSREEYVTSEDNELGIRGYTLFHDYYFKQSSDFASQLIATMLNYNVELGDLVHGYAKADDEEKADECYRRLVELDWFPKIKPQLIARLSAILTNLIEKDAKLAARVFDCGADNRACLDHVTYRALVEISSYVHSELENELNIKKGYLGKIKHEMDTCLYPSKGDMSHQGTK